MNLIEERLLIGELYFIRGAIWQDRLQEGKRSKWAATSFHLFPAGGKPLSVVQPFDRLDWHSFKLVTADPEWYYPEVSFWGWDLHAFLLMCQTRLQLSTFFRVHSSHRTAATTRPDGQMFKWCLNGVFLRIYNDSALVQRLLSKSPIN